MRDYPNVVIARTHSCSPFLPAVGCLFLMRIAGIILDLDGTLFDSDRAYAESLQSIGIDPLGAPFLEARKRVKAQLPSGHVSARNRLLYFKQMLESDGRYSPQALLECLEGYEKALVEHLSRQWKALERDSLFARFPIDIPRVLLTNETTRTQMLKLRAVDPTGKWFPKVVTSEEIGVEKPHPHALDTALKILGLPPSDCLMVGDNAEHDILPAHERGMTTILTQEFSTEPMPKVPTNTKVILSLNEVLEVFQ